MATLTVGLMGAQCNPKAPKVEGSEFSTISFTLPPGEYDTARIGLSRYGGSVNDSACTEDSESTESSSGGNINVNKSVKNGCDYLLVLTLGVTQDGQFQPLFSNRFQDKPGEIFARADLTGGTIEREIVVYALNGNQAGNPLIPGQNSTHLRINVSIRKPSSAGAPNEAEPPSTPTPRPNPPNQPNPPSGSNSPNPSSPLPDGNEPGATPPPSIRPLPPRAPFGTGFPNEKIGAFFENRCAECHAGEGIPYNFGSFPFQVEGSVSQSAILNEIINAISGENPTMPPSPRGRATQDEIDALRSWAESIQ